MRRIFAFGWMVAIAAVVMAVVPGFAQEDEAEALVLTRIFVEPELDLQVEYPPGWDASSNLRLGEGRIIISGRFRELMEEGDDSFDAGRVSIHISILEPELYDDRSLREIAEDTVVFNDYDLIDSQEITVQGEPAHLVIFDTPSDSNAIVAFRRGNLTLMAWMSAPFGGIDTALPTMLAILETLSQPSEEATVAPTDDALDLTATLRDVEMGLQIDYPDDWFVDTTPMKDTFYFMDTPTTIDNISPEQVEPGQFIATFTIIADEETEHDLPRVIGATYVFRNDLNVIHFESILIGGEFSELMRYRVRGGEGAIVVFPHGDEHVLVDVWSARGEMDVLLQTVYAMAETLVTVDVEPGAAETRSDNLRAEIDLPQTLDVPELGLGIAYPEGWIAGDVVENEFIYIADSEKTVAQTGNIPLEAGQVFINLSPMPRGVFEGMNAGEFLAMYVDVNEVDVTSQRAVTVQGTEAWVVTHEQNDNDTATIGLRLEEDRILVLGISTAKGEIENVLPTIYTMLETIDVYQEAAPTAGIDLSSTTTFVERDLGVQFEVPAGWIADSDPDERLIILADSWDTVEMSDELPREVDDVYFFMSVIPDGLFVGMTPRQIIDGFGVETEVKVLDSGPVTLSNGTGHYITYDLDDASVLTVVVDMGDLRLLLSMEVAGGTMDVYLPDALALLDTLEPALNSGGHSLPRPGGSRGGDG